MRKLREKNLVSKALVEAEEVEAVVRRTADGVVSVTRTITGASDDRSVRHSSHPRLTQLTQHRLDEVAHLYSHVCTGTLIISFHF